ncbi:Competence protein ComM [bacterium HR40]|nr:Competence protein ComM [bacterium HR40]
MAQAALSLRTARAHTIALLGLEAADVEVEVQLSAGLPAFAIVGLPDKAVAESRERVRAALAAMGLSMPTRRITVNLAPGDIPKEGSHYDLPIALGLLAVMGVLPGDALDGRLALGELGLDGSLRPVAGVLPAALAAAERGMSLVCPATCGAEAAWLADSIDILAAANLLELIAHLRGDQLLAPPSPALAAEEMQHPDLRDVRGQETAKRALEIAAAGGHNLLMIGPPGSGKSMLAVRLVGLLPPLQPYEVLEVGMIHSVGGRLVNGKLPRSRPFRAPHHSASMAAMVGGGPHARPGEVSLAHRGVLFLDELPEFNRNVLEALRQPLEAGTVTVARANLHVTYPARFQLVAAMNPCRCGHLDDPTRACSRAPACAAQYQGRISGPLYDRIDLFVDVPAVSPQDLLLPPPGEGSREVAARVAAARELQAERSRAAGCREPVLNAALEGDLLERLAPIDRRARELLLKAAERLRLSARSWHRLVRVARTIADLEGAEVIGRTHVAEAVSYRRRPPEPR